MEGIEPSRNFPGVGLLIVLLLATRASAVQDACVTLSGPNQTNGQFQFTLTGEANVSYVIEKSTDLQTWIPVMTNTATSITRLILIDGSDDQSFYRTTRGPLPLFGFALAANQAINLNCNNLSIDSYDSSDPNYSTNGRYDPAKARDKGDVVTNSGLTNSISISNARIKGVVHTGTNGTVAIGSNDSVGSTAWVDGGNSGIQPGWFLNDMNNCFPDVLPPFTSGAANPFGKTINGTNYTYILGTDNYLRH